MRALGRRPVVAQVRHQGAVLLEYHGRLYAALADDGLAGVPGVALVVADGHDAVRVAVGIHGHQDAARGQFQRVRAREPAHAREVLVRGFGDQLLRPFGARSGFRGRGGGEVFGERYDVFGHEHDVVLELPFRRTRRLLVVGGDAVLHERGLPLVGDDQRPQEEQALPRIQEQDRVGFREARRIGQRKRRRPFARGMIPARGLNQHIVRRAFTGAVKPAHQQIAVGQLDNRGGVVVPLLQGEDQFTRILGRGGGTAGGEQESGNHSHHRD